MKKRFDFVIREEIMHEEMGCLVDHTVQFVERIRFHRRIERVAYGDPPPIRARPSDELRESPLNMDGCGHPRPSIFDLLATHPMYPEANR
jgi:hypothetical protein